MGESVKLWAEWDAFPGDPGAARDTLPEMRKTLQS
jgi:hypothetical protein